MRRRAAEIAMESIREILSMAKKNPLPLQELKKLLQRERDLATELRQLSGSESGGRR